MKNPEKILLKHLKVSINTNISELEKEVNYQNIINAMNEYKYGQRKNPLIWRVIQRLLMFIPWLTINIIGHTVALIKQIINYIKYGGESITYTEMTRQRLISDIFDLLSENYNKGK